MTEQEAKERAARARASKGSSWPTAQDLGGSWGLAWSDTDITIGEVLRRRSLGLPDYPPTSFPTDFLEIREGDG